MPTYVTRPFLPPLAEFLPRLEAIWQSRILSNCGPQHAEFEDALCAALGTKHVSLFGNGTLALLVALRALNLEDAEIITTPFSFVATSNVILWSRNTPVFVDIEPGSVNIDPAKIEAAITPRTKAILAVHCYGHPCDTERISAIASKHGLKVLYDAAHAFGVELSTGSLLNHGDLSVVSFHATKVMSSGEGGAVVCHTPAMKATLDRLRNFGFANEIQVDDIGINAKMPELSAALGLLQLKYYEQTCEMRGVIDSFYRQLLRGVTGIECIENGGASKKNYSYFPVLIKDSYPLDRDALYELLKRHDIYARRYFYPLISDFSPFRHLSSAKEENLPIATEIARRVLCLPIYPDLPLKFVETICDIIRLPTDRPAF